MKTLTVKYNSVCKACRAPILDHSVQFPVKKNVELYPSDRIKAALLDPDAIKALSSPMTITTQCPECGSMSSIKVHWFLDEHNNFMINRIKSEV